MSMISILLSMTLLLSQVLNAAPLKNSIPGSAASNQIIISKSGTVVVTVSNTITNLCNGTAGLQSPETIELFPDYKSSTGKSVVLGPYDAFTELIFYISPWSACEGYTYLSTDPNHAKVTPLDAPNTWRIDWEDLPDQNPPDYDYNDLIMVVSLISSVPDYKQDNPNWEADSYGNLNLSLGSVGSAVSSSAGLLNYFGAVGVDTQTLNQCLSRPDVQGYLGTDADPDCAGENIEQCDAGLVRWSKVPVCTDSSDPSHQPYLLKWEQTLNLGDHLYDADSGLTRVVTPTMLTTLTDQDLARGWPVIFQVSQPVTPTAVHYLLATEKLDGEGVVEYVVNDPWCGDWPACSMSMTKLAADDPRLVGIVRFAPNDREFYSSLVISGLSPGSFYLVDPLGRRLGYSELTGTHYAEVPAANYYFQAPLFNVMQGKPQGDGVQELYIIDPVPGEYELMVFPASYQPYHLMAEYHAAPLSADRETVLASQDGLSVYRYRFTLVADAPLLLEPLQGKGAFLPLVQQGP